MYVMKQVGLKDHDQVFGPSGKIINVTKVVGMEKVKIIIFLLYIAPMAKTHIAGTFFWHPRLGLHLAPQLETQRPVNPPSKDNIHDGLVVLIDGYSIGVTVLAVAAGYRESTRTLKHMSLLHAPFYTNAYRWGLRHVNLLPLWLKGPGSKYPETHKVWRRRYYYIDEFVPHWMRYLTPWIKKNEWEEEEKEYQGYMKFAEPTFGKHYKYPSKIYTEFISQFTKETTSDLHTKET